MMNYNGFGWGSGFGFGVPWFPGIFIVFLLWSFVWKGLALWHSAKRDQKWWFIAMMVVNTFGILEIAYLFFVAKLTLADMVGGLSGADTETRKDDESHAS